MAPNWTRLNNGLGMTTLLVVFSLLASINGVVLGDTAADQPRWNPWGEDLREKLSTDYLHQYEDSLQKFLGNQTHRDYFKLLRQDGDALLIGARNVIYNVSIHTLEENVAQRITWNPSEKDRSLCLIKGKSEDDCQNYIRVLAQLADGRLLVCGTNAYNPRCRHYSHNVTHTSVDKEFSGKGFCPYDPRHNSTAIYADGELYSGTVADFSATDSLIIKDRLRTEQYDYKHLNAPNFVSSLEDEDHVYFFFREAAVEYMNCGKAVFSRVARVCKNDSGGPHKFRNKWTTFLKSRLNCSVPGDLPFYFNEIQSTSHVMHGDLVYGVFTTPENSIAGSAICAFHLKDMLKVFEEGPFKHQQSIFSNWLATNSHQEPSPRPGQCSTNSSTLPESNLNFIKHHSLMDWAVPAAFSQPLFIKTSLGERLTVIAVDPAVKTVEGSTLDVVFVGTSSGRVLKIANVNHNDASSSPNPVLIEALQVFPYDTPVRNILVARPSAEIESKLIVLSDHEVAALPLHRCSAPAAQSCGDCVALRDPYCAWDVQMGLCVEHSRVARNALGEVDFVQEMRYGMSPDCPTPVTFEAEPTTTLAPTTSTESTSQATTTPEEEQQQEQEDTTETPLDYPQGSIGEEVSPECACECRKEDDPHPALDEDATSTQTTTMGGGRAGPEQSAPTSAPYYDVSRMAHDVNIIIEDTRIEGDSDLHSTNRVPLFQPIDGPFFGEGEDYYDDDNRHVATSATNRPAAAPAMYSEQTLALSTLLTALCALSIGVVAGYWLAKRADIGPGGCSDANDKEGGSNATFSSTASSSCGSDCDGDSFRKPHTDSGYTTPIRTNTPPSTSATHLSTPRATPTCSISSSGSNASSKSLHLISANAAGGAATSHGTLPSKGLMVKRYHNGTLTRSAGTGLVAAGGGGGGVGPPQGASGGTSSTFYHAYAPSPHPPLTAQMSMPVRQQTAASHLGLQEQQSVPVLGRAVTGSPASATMLRCQAGSTDSLQKVKRVYL